MKKIYISGKITGLDPVDAEKKFQEAEEFLKHVFPEKNIVNPMKSNWKNKTWEDYMIDDIKLLFECDAIFMLYDWKDSKGATIEHFIAEVTNKEILYQR